MRRFKKNSTINSASTVTSCLKEEMITFIVFLLFCARDDPTSWDLPLWSFLPALPLRIYQNSGGSCLCCCSHSWQMAKIILQSSQGHYLEKQFSLPASPAAPLPASSCSSCWGIASMDLLLVSVVSTLIHDPWFLNSYLCS